MEGKLSGVEMAEYARLRESVAQIEAALRVPGAMDAFTTSLMLRFLENAKGRIAGLEVEDSRRAEEERSKEAQEQRLAVMVERERALSTAEKQEYAALLREDHFTRADFGRLEHFYAHSWDKLTEEGKDELSYRVWEGVRRNEFKFKELPDTVKEKQAERIEHGLSRAGRGGEELGAIPEQDKTAFLDARHSGQRKQSYEILERPSFAEHVATKPSGVSYKSAAASPEQPAPEQVAVHECMNSKRITLQGIKDIDAEAGSMQPPLPERSGSAVKLR